MTRFFDGLAGLRVVTTLCLVLLAFVCGWVAGGNAQRAVETDGEVATMATAQEVAEVQRLIKAEVGVSPDDEADVAVDLRAPRLSARSEIAGAANLTKVDKKVGVTADPEC